MSGGHKAWCCERTPCSSSRGYESRPPCLAASSLPACHRGSLLLPHCASAGLAKELRLARRNSLNPEMRLVKWLLEFTQLLPGSVPQGRNGRPLCMTRQQLSSHSSCLWQLRVRRRMSSHSTAWAQACDSCNGGDQICCRLHGLFPPAPCSHPLCSCREVTPGQVYHYQVQAVSGTTLGEASPPLVHVHGAPYCGDGKVTA